MGSGSKERTTARPKLRLTEQADVPQGDSGDGIALELKQLCQHHAADVFFFQCSSYSFFIAKYCNPENAAFVCSFFLVRGYVFILVLKCIMYIL